MRPELQPAAALITSLVEELSKKGISAESKREFFEKFAKIVEANTEAILAQARDNLLLLIENDSHETDVREWIWEAVGDVVYCELMPAGPDDCFLDDEELLKEPLIDDYLSDTLIKMKKTLARENGTDAENFDWEPWKN